MKSCNIFSVRLKKKTRLKSPPQRSFYVYSKQSNSNPKQGETYPENTEVSKKEIDHCHSARRLSRITKILNRKCYTKWLFLRIQENFQENIRNSMIFLIFLTKTLHQRCFLKDFLRYFRTPHDGCFFILPRKLVVPIFVSIEMVIRWSCNKEL